MMNEVWKDIQKAPNYEVSNLGNIRHKKRKQNLKFSDNGRGYLFVRLRVDDKKINIYVHKAVAEAFIENDDPINNTDVSHLDETRTNNRADNLKWTTHKENCSMPKFLERTTTANQIITKKLQTPIYCVELDRVFEGQNAAARELGLQQSNIHKCLNGERNTTGGYHWRYMKEED